MKYYYYAVFEPEDNGAINISFPDLQGCFTFGEDIEDALKMSKDALEGYLMVAEDEGDDIPAPSSYHELQTRLTDGQALQLVAVDTDLSRQIEMNKSVNKMVTIPKWLLEMGKEKRINFSQLLQKALRDELQI